VCAADARYLCDSYVLDTFVPCGGLSWLHVSFLLHVKYTISYRIVSYCIISTGISCIPFSSYLTLNNIATLKTGLGSLMVIEIGTVPFESSDTVSYSHSIVNVMLCRFRDKARYLWKIAIFHIPCIGRPC